MNKKKVIFFDVDDTVCPSTQPVSEAMAAELNRRIDQGLELAFISGSTTEQLWGQLGFALKGDYHLLGASGTCYERVQGGARRVIYSHELPQPERERIAGLFRELARRHGILSLTTEEDQIQDRGSQVTFSAIGRHAPEALKRAFDPQRRLRAAWAAELKQSLGAGFQIGIGGTTSLDVTLAGLDKGWGIKEFLKHHGWQAADAVFYGDNLKEGGNDYPARAVVDCIEVADVDDTLKQLKARA